MPTNRLIPTKFEAIISFLSNKNFAYGLNLKNKLLKGVIIQVENANNEKDLFLELRRGHFVSRKNSPDEFISEYVFIASDTSILKIQKICKQRIEENNPSR